ncbi:sigma 54-interacting transcriptional regulator [Clostridium nigeriense]|uniref:sigma 54-interacting transcriptional regulator n=1 Tax=Clostridium nigeriense TaxID=1805470 RepID=UPI003D344494
MKRIDLIYNTIKNLDSGEGVTTLEISKYLNLERSNVSKDLNLLLKNGKLFKNNSRPVKYFFNNPNATDFSKKSALDKLSYLYPSLAPAVKLAKTAILYPPNGMNSLIIGDTGVGKSMLAKLMHEYANSLDTSKDMPFIHFNCSDYSNNTQLLSAQLFGVKKGTFTGANEDRPGLIEEANGGILFLDEIHNLPSEGQEMLFVFMDTGYFKRLGEVSKRIKSSARIICATNKDINQSLLNTFIRRIPIKINLPDLNERLIEERLTLVEYFIKEESLKLDKPILVSKNSMLSLLSYDCPYNVGQLKSDITLAVANSYTDYFINNKKHIKINSPDLPKDIKSALNKNLDKERKLLESLNCVDGYFVYDKNTEITSHSFIKQKHIILSKYKDLINNIDGAIHHKDSCTNSIVNHFNNYIDTVIENQSNFSYTFEESAYDELLSKLLILDKDLKERLSNDTFKRFLHIHIDMIYDRIDLIDSTTLPSLNKLKSIYKDYYPLTLEIKSLIEKNYNINLSDLEVVFLITLVILIKNEK